MPDEALCKFYDEYMTGNTRDELTLKYSMLKKSDDDKNLYNLTTPEYQMILDVIQAIKNKKSKTTKESRNKEYQKMEEYARKFYQPSLM